MAEKKLLSVLSSFILPDALDGVLFYPSWSCRSSPGLSF